ncbi:MAG: FAD-dependent oxidoreductase [Candidatus Geothermarchaeales archaeon]
MTSSETLIGAVLVVGGGVSGVQSALDLADSGFKVYLVEKTPSIGGIMAQLDKTFPTGDCSMCILSPKLVGAGRHANIELITNAELTGVEGEVGNFIVTIRKKARFVDEEKCTGCGICTEKCPVRVPNEFDQGLSMRRAIYLPFPQAVPLIYSVDEEHCIYTRFRKGCRICVKRCPAEAIDFDQKPEEILKLGVGSIILSPGFEKFDPTVKTEYGYGKYPNVITSIEFERLLNSSGPTKGHIERPSDHKSPRNIAFIQCVGSRDEQLGVSYCSSVCCMYAMKEAMVALEHDPNLRIQIFFIDIRAFGKEFDDYYQRAKNESKITFTRSKVAEISEDPDTHNLILHFIEDESGEVREEEFDMVVLSIGLRPPKDAERLSKILGIELDNYGFCKTGIFSPIQTTRPGVFVGGAFTAPKDIADTVALASGAAAQAAEIISPARNSLTAEKELVPEVDVSGQEPRIGLYVCHCGGNIGRVIDVPAVVEEAKNLANVIFAEEIMYACSYESLERIKDLIKEHRLNRFIVAACSPRTHEALFQSAVREGGLNPYLFEMANIRDQCSWVHMEEPKRATEKAKDLVRMVVAKTRLNKPLFRAQIDVSPSALVIGGGLSGMMAALELSLQGFDVHLVEREASLGGNLQRIHYLASDQDPQEFLGSLIERVMSNERIMVHTNSRVVGVDGYVGNFDVKIRRDGEEQAIKVGAIVVATGGSELKPSEYLYSENRNVLTQLEFGERLHNGEVDADSVVMIQCVGSRVQERPYCSRVCCTHAVRNALELKRMNPDVNIYILYKDMRTYGFNEDLYREASREGVLFIRYDESKPEVAEEDGGLVVTVKDPILNEYIHIRPDLIVLSSAIVPQEDNEILAKMLKVPLSKDGFFLEAHMKLRPVDFATDGVFLCGLAHAPKSIKESIAQAYGAAQRAAMILSKDALEAEGVIASVDEALCTGCRACDDCPFNAIEMVDRRVELRGFAYHTRKARVNEALCKGCGKCASLCPNGAIELRHFSDEQVVSEIFALLEAA